MKVYYRDDHSDGDWFVGDMYMSNGLRQLNIDGPNGTYRLSHCEMSVRHSDQALVFHGYERATQTDALSYTLRGVQIRTKLEKE